MSGRGREREGGREGKGVDGGLFIKDDWNGGRREASKGMNKTVYGLRECESANTGERESESKLGRGEGKAGE